MSLISSFSVFWKILREDGQLARMGARRGELLRLHYGGRWETRRGMSPRLRHLKFLLHGRRVNLELSAAYLGAIRGIFLEGEYNCATLVAQPPVRILDLGANIGMGALYLNVLFPRSQFLCVEPDPRNLPLLEKNLWRNGVPVTIKSCAVASQSGTLALRFDNNPTCSALETSPMHTLEQRISVPVCTVVELMNEVGWDSVDLVKIDIEGTEDELLSQSNSWLHSAKALIMEIHPNTTPEKIAFYLKPFNFELRRICWKTEPVYFASRFLC
jgi:FkbM family methyltransferase